MVWSHEDPGEAEQRALPVIPPQLELTARGQWRVAWRAERLCAREFQRTPRPYDAALLTRCWNEPTTLSRSSVIANYLREIQRRRNDPTRRRGRWAFLKLAQTSNRVMRQSLP